MSEMVSFYTEIFEVRFKEIVENINGKEWKLYLGNLGEIEFFLCPNEPSGTEENQLGVHQFHLTVSEIEKFVETVRQKGIQVDQVPFGKGKLNFCLRDPDGNPWILSN